MDKKHRALGLRIINELITSYAKIDIAPSARTSKAALNDAILTPSWLLEMKQELILGKYAKLPDVIEKIKVTLVDCLREMGPYLTALGRILLHEQILQYEVQRLPQSLKNRGKANIQKNKKNHKSSLALKKRGIKGYHTIPSFLLNVAIQEQGAVNHGKFCNTAKVTEESVLCPVKENENKAGASKQRKMPTKRCALEQDDVPIDLQESTKSRNSKCMPSKSTSSPKMGPEKKAVMKKTTAVASKRSQKSKTEKTDRSGRVQPSRLRKLWNFDIGQKKTLMTSKNTGKTKLGKRKLPLNENKEVIDSKSNTTETVSKTDECSSMAEDQPSIKLKRMTCKDTSHHLQYQIEKKKPLSQPPAGLTTQSDVRTDTELKTSTPKKDESISITAPGLYIIPGFAVRVIERSGKDQLAEIISDNVESSEKSDLVAETTMLVDTAENLSLAVINNEGGGAPTRRVQRKKHSSKFLKKGNQLMGIEEEDITEQDKHTNGKGIQEVTIEEGFKDNNPLNTDISILECESSQDNKTGKHKSTATTSKHQTESTNTNLSIEKIPSCVNSLSDGKVDDDEPEVLGMVSKERQRRFSNKIDSTDSEITVEKVIALETIPDDDEQEKNSIGSLVQKESTEVMKKNCKKGKFLSKKKTSISSKSSERIAKKKTPTAKKRLAKALSKKGVESTNHSLLIGENQLMNPAGESVDDCLNISDITIDDNMRRLAEEWLNTELIPGDISFETLTQNAGVPEISCFLHACQKALCLPFFTHFEFELSLIIPHASRLMARVITALLSGVPSSKETKMCSPLPYLQWNRKLTARISHWFFIHRRLKHDSKVQDLIGLEPIFWKILGSNRNPLSLKPFHQLPIHQRVMILKGLCDHLFHVSKKIQTALISTPRGGREGNWLGEDGQGVKYLHIPFFLREYVGDLRIYCVDNSKLFSCTKEESFQETETCKTSKERRDIGWEYGLKEVSNNEAGLEINYENHHKDKTFSLVAENVEKLNTLVASICSPFTEDELSDAERKLSQKVVKVDKEINYQKLTKTDDEDDPSVEVPPDVENTDSRNEHLLLAVMLKSLAKSLNPKEDMLTKSRTAALVKLHMEWMEFNKDGFSIGEKQVASNENNQKRRWSEKRLPMEKNDQQDKNFEEPSNIKSGQQPLPKRESLSRWAKSKAGCLSQEEDTRISRKEIVAELEERALVGSNNLSEEESKWDPSLWADEDSDDDAQDEDIVVEDLIWYGYAAIQKEATRMEQHPPTRVSDGTADCSATKQDSSITTSSTRKGSLLIHKNRITKFSSKHDIEVGKPVVITHKSSADSQEEIQILGENFKGKRLNSYRIKIKKEDLDYCLDKNKPEFLIDLVRKNIAQHNHMNSKPDASIIPCVQNHPSNSNSTRNLDAGSVLPQKNLAVSKVQEINESQSLAKKSSHSFNERKLPSKCGSLGLPTSKSTSDSLESAPLKVIKLKLPTIDGEGKAKLYTKQELETVTTFVLKAVNENDKHGISTTPQAITMVHNDNQTGIQSEDGKEIIIPALKHDNKLSQSKGNGAPEVGNITDDKHLHEERHSISGFQPFRLKSMLRCNLQL